MKKMLIGIGIVILFLIIPVDNIKFYNYETSVNKAAYDETFPGITHGNTVSQGFIPQYDYIKKIEIYIREVKGESRQGYWKFSILDSKKEPVYEEKISLTELASPGWYTVFSEIELMAGESYYLNIDAVDTLDAGPGLAIFTVPDAAAQEEEGQVLTYGEFPIENGTLKISFEYLKPLNRLDYLVFYLFAIFMVSFIITNLKRSILYERIHQK